jgi:hypothetical protein
MVADGLKIINTRKPSKQRQNFFCLLAWFDLPAWTFEKVEAAAFGI